MAEENGRAEEIKRLNSLKDAVSKEFLSGKLQANPQRQKDISLLLDQIEILNNDLGFKEPAGTPEEFASDVLKALPTAGAIAGGAISGGLGLIPAAGLVGLGAAGGEGFKQVGEEILAQSQGETTSGNELERLGKIANEGITGATGELIGGGLGRAASGLLKIRPIEQINAVKKAAKSAPGFKLGTAQRFEPTGAPGQATRALAEGPALLASAPTQIRTRTQFNAIDRSLRNIIGQPKQMSAFDAGSSIKKNIVEFFENTRTPISKEYDLLREQYGDAPIPKDITNDAIGELQSLRIMRTGDPRSKKTVKSVIDSLEELKNTLTIDDVKELRTNFSNSLPSVSSASERRAIRQANSILTRFREDAILDFAVKTKGFEAAAELDGRQQLVDKQFRLFNEKFSELGGFFGRNRKPKDAFEILDFIDSLPEEKIVDRLFKKANIKGLSVIKQEFPSQFETLRDFKIISMTDNATDELGNLSAKKLLNQIDKMEPETVRLLLGQDKQQTISNLKILVSTLPERLNASGTNVRGDLFDPLKQITAVIPALGTALVDNIAGRGALRAAEKPFVRTVFGQMVVQPFTDELGEKNILGFDAKNLLVVPPELVDQAKGVLMKNDSLSTVKKSKLMNLLNKRGLTPKVENESDKQLTPKELRLKQFINKPIPSGGSL